MILRAGNRAVMERRFKDRIVFYAQGREINFGALDEFKPDHFTYDDTQDLFRSGKARLKRTAVFIDRFFYKRSIQDLAEKYGVKKNTIACMYRDAVNQINKILDILDQRRKGLKAVSHRNRLSDDEKYFLLIHVFGFSCSEVAEMMEISPKALTQRMNRRFKGYREQYFSTKL